VIVAATLRSAAVNRLFRSCLAALIAASLVITSTPWPSGGVARAQVITDPTAPIAFQPQVLLAPNGVPVVNIVAPNAGGVSHNKYSDYNVGAQGLVLNNSASAGISVLAGSIWANPKLGGRPARVILNEVTGTSPSLLAGLTEVFGSKADVIVANPLGVTCKGCGFLNTGRITLTTGVAGYDAGSNLYFDVTQGSVRIEAEGFLVGVATGYGDKGRPNSIDILARQVELVGAIGDSRPDAQVSAVEILAGANRVFWESKARTRLTGGGQVAVHLYAHPCLGGDHGDSPGMHGAELRPVNR
jgi:filamentous hemagglutinin family protein